MDGKRWNWNWIAGSLVLFLAWCTPGAATRTNDLPAAARSEPGSVTVALPIVTQMWCPPMNGTTYYVAPDGDDANPGTERLPLRTIQTAIGMVGPGDTVYVRAGTYREELNIRKSGTACAPITIAGYRGERPVIDGEYTLPEAPDATCDPVSGKCFVYRGLVKIDASHVIFEGFELTRSKGAGVRMDEGSDYSTVRNCWIHDTRSGGIRVAGHYATVADNRLWNCSNYCTYPRPPEPLTWPPTIRLHEVHHATVSRNQVFNNYGEGITAFQTNYATIEDNTVYDNMRAGIYLNRAAHTIVQRNLVYFTTPFWMEGNPPSGIAIATEERGTEGFSTANQVVNNIVVGGRHSFSTIWQVTTAGGLVDTLIAHNTFVNAQGSDRPTNLQLTDNPANRNTIITNNIFVQDDPNGRLAWTESTQGVVFSHNLWSRTPPESVRGVGDVVGSPQFVNGGAVPAPGVVEADWYGLQRSSPARDAGHLLTTVPEDFSGYARDDNPDIGAYEYQVAAGSAKPATATPAATPTPGAPETDSAAPKP